MAESLSSPPPVGFLGRAALSHQHLELLNRLGQSLSLSTGARSGYPTVVRDMRAIFGVDAVSLWTVDQSHQLLVKESLDAAEEVALGELDLQFDEQMTHWQIRARRSLVLLTDALAPTQFPVRPALRRWNLITLPVLHRDQLIGVVNVYSRAAAPPFFSGEGTDSAAELLVAVGSQLELFITNRSLEASTTFYKEIHHRVKNNLQSVASVLRMQIRRLDRISAEQALEDSINRIQSIALVHETLSQGEIGRVDAGELIGRITRMLTGELPDPPRVTLRAASASVMLMSREATALALVVTELLQNAMRHGHVAAPGVQGDAHIEVGLDCRDRCVEVTIADQGPGLPPDFDFARQSNLGLTIVTELVADVLKGEFRLRSDRGTIATITFPLDQGSLPFATAFSAAP